MLVGVIVEGMVEAVTVKVPVEIGSLVTNDPRLLLPVPVEVQLEQVTSAVPLGRTTR